MIDTSQIRETVGELFGPRLDRLQTNASIAAGFGLILTIIGAVLDPPVVGGSHPSVFHSYLYAYMFWFGVTTGSLALLMLHHVVGGGWGYLIRRLLEAATRLLPWMLVLFIPVVIGLLYFGLYEWARPPAAPDAVLQFKSSYLNVPFFLARTVFYFAVWIWFAWRLNSLGAVLDQRNDVPVCRRLNTIGARGLVVYCLTITFVMVDWVMSLTPHWYSTIFGMLAIVSQALATLALMLVLLAYLAGDEPLLREVPSGFFRDLGNLTLAFVMLWGYMSLSQYLITYSGNTQEEITWYVRRRSEGWGFVSLGLIPLHFFLPFILLLVGSGIKRNPKRLAKVATYLVLMRLLDLFWVVTPTFRPQIGLSVADIGTPLLIGGIWLWLWAGQLKAMRDRPVVPTQDPRLVGNWQEVVEYG